MATQTTAEPLVSVEEYLASIYHPDCEYNDGVIEERNLGEFEHSFLQANLATIFTNHTEEWGVFGLTEQRVQINPRRFLIPDVTVLRVDASCDPILHHPPFIAIEILSPEDKKRDVLRKIVEYLDFGVEHVWFLDPGKRMAFRGIRNGLEPVPSGDLDISGTPILVRTNELFDKLDRFRKRP